MGAHHEIVIVGGGTAGLTVAAQLKVAGLADVAVIEPAQTHYYQPLWTLVGGGVSKAEASARPMASVMPKGVTWIQASATGIDPAARSLTLDNGSAVTYDQLVMAPGIQLNWGGIDGLEDTLGANSVSSNYRYDLAPKTWDFIRGMKSGTAVFTQPNGPIKCAGAPQKIAYLAADYWKSQGILDKMDIHLILPTPGMFGVPVFAKLLEQAVDRYGIKVHFKSDIASVDGKAKEVEVRNLDDSSTTKLGFDMAHIVPPQSAPDWIKASPLADPASPFGYINVNKNTMQHVDFPEIFALGDAGNTPNSKTGAAIRKQAPVVTKNVLAARAGKDLPGHYNGYASCPLTTGRNKLVLAEFDYDLNPAPSVPFGLSLKEMHDFGQFKKTMMPSMYWNLMLKGRF